MMMMMMMMMKAVKTVIMLFQRLHFHIGNRKTEISGPQAGSHFLH